MKANNYSNSNNHHHLSDDEIQAAFHDEADHVLDFRSEKLSQNPVVVWETHTNKPLVWVIPDLLTRDEYHYVLGQMHPQDKDNDIASSSTISSDQGHTRLLFGKDIPHNLRALDWDGNTEPLSTALQPRLQHEYQRHTSTYHKNDIDPMNLTNTIHSVHPTWRVLQLKEGEEFPAHQDGMDQAHDINSNINNGAGVFAASTHSILLEFVVPGDLDSDADSNAAEIQRQQQPGGATRFFYRKYPFDGPYDHCVDVYLPPGWAFIMEQRADLWYALRSHTCRKHNNSNDSQKQQQPLQQQCRYVAQTGLLKQVPPGETVESMRQGARGTFSLGPGLTELFQAHAAEACHDEAAPLEWGEHSYNPKATMWEHGRPLIYTHSTTTTTTNFHQQRQKSLPGLAKEPGSSMVNQTTTNLNESVRERVRRRNSLQRQVDPIHNRVLYGLPSPNKNHAKMVSGVYFGGDSVTSRTADFDYSESHQSLEDEPLAVATSHPSDAQQVQVQQRRLSSIQVTRKPCRDSIVGKLVKVFQP